MKEMCKRFKDLADIEGWLEQLKADYVECGKPIITADMCKDPYVAVVRVGEKTRGLAEREMLAIS